MTDDFTFDSSLFSDLHKDAYGFRPYADHEFFIASNERKQEIWNQTLKFLDMAMDEEDLRVQQSIKNFESHINTLYDLGAGSREQAIRWILQGVEGIQSANPLNAEEACHELGLPRSYMEELQNFFWNP